MDRLFALVIDGQTYMITERELSKFGSTGIATQDTSIASSSSQVPVKQTMIQGAILHQPIEATPTEVNEMYDGRTLALVTTGNLIPLNIQGQSVLLQTEPSHVAALLPISHQLKFTRINIPASEPLHAASTALTNGEQPKPKETMPGTNSIDKLKPIAPRPDCPHPIITQLDLVTPDKGSKSIVFHESVVKMDYASILKRIGYEEPMEAIIRLGPYLNEVTNADKENQGSGVVYEGSDSSIHVDGLLVVCSNCGVSSQDFDRCDRCRKKIASTCRVVKDEKRGGTITVRKKRCIRRIKKPEEPVCLTISSDEEEGSNQDSTPAKQADTLSQVPSQGLESSNCDETKPSQSPLSGEGVNGVDYLSLMDARDMERLYMSCRTVRIGSYKVVPENSVAISEYGFSFSVPSVEGSTEVVKINRSDVKKLLVNFEKQCPAFFFYVTPAAGQRIRKTLRMPDCDESPVFDPTSSDDPTKTITLLPNNINEELRLFIKSIYGQKGVLQELNSRETDRILVQAAEKLKTVDMLKKEQPSVSLPITTIMVYPPPPTKGGISINTEDYACLGEDQFLNDVIIDFYLKYLLQSVLSEEDRKRTHVFSSFFYKRLTTRVGPTSGTGKFGDDPKLSAAEKRHSRVKGWTKTVDLFDKDFIIIPINENSHWFLAIICFPGLKGPVRMTDDSPIDVKLLKAPPRKKRGKNDKGSILVGGPIPATIGATTITVVSGLGKTITLETEEEDRDEAEAEEDDMEPSSSDDDGARDSSEELLDEATHKTPKPPKPEVEPIKQPCILIFDSLAGAGRSRVCATLRDYLKIEYKVRHKSDDRDFSKDVFKGACPKVPQQTNFTDCGLYVLQYVEAFFEKPISDYRMPIKELMNWFPTEVVSRKRFDIQQLLHRLMEEQNINVSALHLPFLGLKDGDKMSYDDDEEAEEEEELGDEEMVDEEEDLGDEDLGENGDLNSSAGDVDIHLPLDEEEEEIEEEEDHSFDGEPEDDGLGIENLKRKSPSSLKEVRNPRLLNEIRRDVKKRRTDAD